uniref:Uncharacterized protein n=1 Tax=Anopheles albimanus TaxID=7167 RepID=A0A182FKQ5_ANOAL
MQQVGQVFSALIIRVRRSPTLSDFCCQRKPPAGLISQRTGSEDVTVSMEAAYEGLEPKPHSSAAAAAAAASRIRNCVISKALPAAVVLQEPRSRTAG